MSIIDRVTLSQSEEKNILRMLPSGRVVIGLVVCVGLALLAVVIVLVVSLIPLFFENKAVSTTKNQAKGSSRTMTTS